MMCLLHLPKHDWANEIDLFPSLDVPREVAIQHDPDSERARCCCHRSWHILWELHLDPEALLWLDRHRLGEAERSHWIRLAMVCHVTISRVHPGAGREPERGHLDHGFLPDQQGAHRVIDQLR